VAGRDSSCAQGGGPRGFQTVRRAGLAVNGLLDTVGNVIDKRRFGDESGRGKSSELYMRGPSLLHLRLEDAYSCAIVPVRRQD
jgi:hypothetical protein